MSTAELADPNSKLVDPPHALEIFKTVKTDMSIQEIDEIPYRPSATYLPHSGDLHFDIPPSAEDYTIPASFALTCGLQIQTAEGNNLAQNDRVGPVNNFPHSVIQTTTVTVGNQVVHSDVAYPFTANHSITLTYGMDAKESHLSLGGYEKDTAGQMDAAIVVGTDAQELTGNVGLNKRGRRYRNSAIVYHRINLICDVFSIDKFIPQNTPIHVVLTRSRPEFCLMAAPRAVAPGVDPDPVPNYRVNIIDPVLWVSRAKIFPTIPLMHQKSFETGAPAKYDFVHRRTRPFTVNAGVRSGTIENVTTGQLPRRLVYGFVRSDAYDGDYLLNPYNFDHINLTQTAVYVDGKSYPVIPFKPHYVAPNEAGGNWVREYWGLFEALGIRNGNSGIGIHKDEFPYGYCLYACDLTPNKCASATNPVNVIKSGVTRIEYQLAEQLQNGYICLVAAEYDNQVGLDGDRNGFVNFTS
jgi:hypothetical protein